MEIKLLVALCALLLINLGSAEKDVAQAAASNATKSGGGEGGSQAPTPVPSSGLEPITPANTTAAHPPDTDSSSTVTSSLSNVTTTEGTPELNNHNGTTIETPSEAAGSEKNLTDQATTQPPSPPPESHPPTSHIPLTTTINPAHTDHTAPVDSTLATTQARNTSAYAKSAAPTQKLETNPSPTTIIVIKATSPTSNDSSSEKPPTSEMSTVHTPQPDEHPGTTAAFHQINTSPTLRSPSTQTRADIPSKLNVEGNTTMVHDSPTLDPLLAGLVSAFIITAVIITLLLFLKLRRRDNRPEFRRLQDLPMDDMMEDTPLSMYSY